MMTRQNADRKAQSAKRKANPPILCSMRYADMRECYIR